MVDAEIEVTHFLANGNMSSNRHIVHFFRHDGTTCDLECFQIITLGKDGRFLDIAESTRVTNDTQMKSVSSEQAMKMYSVRATYISPLVSNLANQSCPSFRICQPLLLNVVANQVAQNRL